MDILIALFWKVAVIVETLGHTLTVGKLVALMAELLVTLLADSTVAGKDLKSVMKSVAHLVLILVGSLGCSMTVEPTVVHIGWSIRRLR